MGIRGRFFGFGCAVGLTSLLSATGAYAEAPAAPAAPAKSAPTATSEPVPSEAAEASGSDIVRLKNGGVVRGKISEMLPGSSVTIISASGKTHEFQMSEVSYAGPESQEPAAATAMPATPEPAPASRKHKRPTRAEWSNDGSGDARPYVTVRGQQANLHLESNPPGLTFHRESSSAIAFGRGGVAHATGFERLCTSPCDISLPAGTETLAVSIEGNSPVSAGSVTFPAGESTIVGTYTSNTPIRIAGAVIGIASVAVGLGLMFTSSQSGSCDQYGYCPTNLNTTKLATGALIMAAGGGIGFGLVFISDSGTVQVSSNSPSPEASARPRSHGLALRGAF